jgi:N-acetyl-anhydromuramyl-L-alanine amidase AmpD
LWSLALTAGRIENIMTKRTATTHIVLHCSATKPSSNVHAARIREWHLAKGWVDIGYHFVVCRTGQIEIGRELQSVGAHVAGWNSLSVGICMVGGLYEDGRGVVDDLVGAYTPEQIAATRLLLQVLKNIYPDAAIVGHRDLSPDKNGDGKITAGEWVKTCPGFDSAREFADILNQQLEDT